MSVILGSIAGAVMVLVFTLVLVCLKKKAKPDRFIPLELLDINKRENNDETIFEKNLRSKKSELNVFVRFCKLLT